MIFPENMGEHLSIDETSLSNGELYTFITNKKGRAKKGTLVASIKGTLSKDIVGVLEMLPLSKRKLVKEVTLDMAKNMEYSVKMCFPNTTLVTDRFHVVKLVIDALQHVRIKHRWEELDKENKAIQRAKEKGKKYKPRTFENEDSAKQLLARSRFVLAKKSSDWTYTQKLRAEILFRQYPVIQEAYKRVMEFRSIYEETYLFRAEKRLKLWINESINGSIKEFYTAANTINNNMENILNFFNNRNTNAFAESFNSKIKLFRANLRGVVKVDFFLFRMYKLFA